MQVIYRSEGIILTSTIKDVAKLAKVSISTVSRVINDSKPVSPEARRRVLKAIEELDLKIPNDISLIGSDKNELLDMFGLNLTYIDECPDELGKESMEILCDIIHNKSYDQMRRTTIVPKIKIRGSEKKMISE